MTGGQSLAMTGRRARRNEGRRGPGNGDKEVAWHRRKEEDLPRQKGETRAVMGRKGPLNEGRRIPLEEGKQKRDSGEKERSSR